MPHLLIVSLNYAPEETGIGPYAAGAAIALAADGFGVSVLAGLPHYPAWRIDRPYRHHLRSLERLDGIAVHRRAHYVPASQSAVKRMLFEGSFLVNAIAGIPPRCDAVIGIIPALADGVLARTLAAVRRVPYGLVFQDLMGPAAGQSGISGGVRVASVARRIEAWSVAGATRVGAVTTAFYPYLRSIGVDDESLDHLPNWTRLGPTTEDRAETRRKMGWRTEDVIVLHSGNMGLKQGLEVVVDAARTSANHGRRLRFVLIGDGNQRAQIEWLGRDLENLQIQPLVPKSQLPNVLRAADVLLVSEKPSVADMSLPSKLTSYFAAGRPIVASVAEDGTTAREIERSGAGQVAPAGDAAALVTTIRRVVDDDALGRALGDAGIGYARTVLDPAAAADRYIAFAHRVLAGKNSRGVDQK